MTDEIPAIARTIHCKQCNAPIELTDLRPAVTCAFCGHAQVVDPDVLDQLAQYRSQVDSQLSAAEHERQVAQTWQQSSRMMTGGSRIKQTVVVLLLAMGLPGICVVTFLVLLNRGVISQQQMTLMGPVVTGASILGIAIYYVWYFAKYRKKKQPGAVQMNTVSCPQCGATLQMRIGQVLETCQHCGASLLPDEQAQEQGLQAASQSHRRARMKRYRAERTGMAVYSKLGMGSTTVALYVGGSFLLPLGGGAIAFTYGMATGSEPYSPGIFLLWAMVLGLVGGIGGFLLWRKNRKDRMADALHNLATRFNGEVLGGVQGTVGWLNRYWAGPFDIKALVKGPYNNSAWFTVDGFPTLVDLDLLAASKHHEPRALVLMAAEIPAVSGSDATLQLTAEIRQIISQISELGFDADFQEGGIIARADLSTIKTLLRHPDTLPPHLSQVSALMVRLARSLAGSPAPPLP